mmetsp:Transcript_29101/g.58679  ORF Transcript_29101/g.58679 Transcript_29101/m.58679 type:complete len:812 (-) Transcript_29101:51-2486(-)
MARALRSGRKIASLSPVSKEERNNGKVKSGNTPAKSTPAKGSAKARTPARSAVKSTPAKKGGASETVTPKRGGKRIAKKEESESEEEEEEETEESESESEDEEEDGSDDDEDESVSDEEDEKVKTPPSSMKKTTGQLKSAKEKSPIKPPKDESESEVSGSDESESEEDECDDGDKHDKNGASGEVEDESGSGDDDSDDSDLEIGVTPLKKAKSPAKVSPKKGGSEEDSSEEDEDEDEESSDDEKDSDNEVENKAFTDDNAKWLKPKSKQKLIPSDEEDGSNDDEFNADNDGDSDEEMLEVERQSKLIDEEMRQEQEEAEMELRRTIAQQTAVFHLPTPEELEEDFNRVVPPSELRARIEDVLEVLADFKSRREPGRSRSEYIERLAQDMAELFGYLQELVDYFLSMLGPNEALEFLEASDKPRPMVVRVNTLKARRKDLAAALMKRGVRLDPLAPWSKVGLKIYESTVPIGATPEYLAGHYMLQSAASMCPVMALGPQPGDRVLDMSAAPGGKTSYIAQLMRNKGVIIANDLKPERQKATVANLHRLGVRNAVTCIFDGRKLGAQMRNSFDRILLDAPCSGLGVISRDPSVKVQRTIPDVLRCAHLQKELLVAAIDALNHKSKKGGGYMVYSTCSVAVAENEEVVNYLLSKRDVKLVDTGLDFGKPGFTRFEHKRFHPSLALTRRFYPHVHNMDGFYVAKIQKLSDSRKGEEDKKKEDASSNDVEGNEVEAKGEKSKAENNSKSNENKHKNSKKKKGKKRSEASTDEINAEEKVSKKRAKISYPTIKKQNQQKKKTNAKITKPRRMKVTGM